MDDIQDSLVDLSDERGVVRFEPDLEISQLDDFGILEGGQASAILFEKQATFDLKRLLPDCYNDVTVLPEEGYVNKELVVYSEVTHGRSEIVSVESPVMVITTLDLRIWLKLQAVQTTKATLTELDEF